EPHNSTNTNTNTGGVKNPRLSSSINLKSDRLLDSLFLLPLSILAGMISLILESTSSIVNACVRQPSIDRLPND
ncbi:MAG: hypothetical protein COB32_08405, partial [Halomonas sp.]